jgi:hypothetical protein
MIDQKVLTLHFEVATNPGEVREQAALETYLEEGWSVTGVHFPPKGNVALIVLERMDASLDDDVYDAARDLEQTFFSLQDEDDDESQVPPRVEDLYLDENLVPALAAPDESLLEEPVLAVAEPPQSPAPEDEAADEDDAAQALVQGKSPHGSNYMNMSW